MLDLVEEIKRKELQKNLKRDAKLFRGKIEFIPSTDRTFIIVLAVHKLAGKNHLEKIGTDRGTPIGGYVRDCSSDCYYMNCRDYVSLGYIGVSYKMNVEGTGYWEKQVPMPESVIMNYLNDDQRQRLEEFRLLFDKDVSFHFLQLIADPEQPKI